MLNNVYHFGAFSYGYVSLWRSYTKQSPSRWGGFCFGTKRRDSKGEGVNEAPGALQSQAPARPQASNPILSAKETDLVSCMPSPFCYVCAFLLSVLLFCDPRDNVFQHHRRWVCQAVFSADERDEFLL